MYSIHVPLPIKQSDDCLIGDVEKFFELLESGYYLEQWTRLRAAASKGIHAESSSEGSTAHVEAPDPDDWIRTSSTPLECYDDSP